MRSEFEVAFNEISELRQLPRDIVLEALSNALISAYKRDAGVGNSQQIEAHIDPNTGRARIFVEKEVVEDVFDGRTEVEIDKARYYEPECDLGDTVMVMVEGSMKKYGRIAAQTAKQVILQKIREAERKALFEEFSVREGDLVTGTVQSVNPNLITVGLGRAEAIMPRNQQIPTERFKPHDKVRAYIMEVKQTPRGPQIVLSRSHRDMLRRLLEYEVPEIYNGLVEIKSIAREPGARSKVAVAALQEGIDPVGACVGMRGGRIQNIVRELHEEKIDVIEWNPNQEQFIAKALSPARVTGVYLEDDPDTGRTAVVIVPDDQLSLAIGKEGQNARLAAKLTSWRIDIKSVTEAVEEALDNLDKPPLKEVAVQQAAMIEDVRRILEKKELGRAIMPEEYTTLGSFADLVQRRWLASREVARKKRVAEINAVKATLPPGAFHMPVDALDLSDEIKAALKSFPSAGDVMLAALVSENKITSRLNNLGEGALEQIQDALTRVVIPEEAEAAAAQEAEAEAAAEAELAAEGEAAEATASEELLAEGEVPAAFPDLGEQATDADKAKTAAKFVPKPAATFEESEDEEVDVFSSGKGKGKGKKGKKKGRQIFYDEERGGTYVKRQRKGGRGTGSTWGGWDEE
ncbi:MAG: transcription termination/antitermination protein NusA [Anaerolineae bacterium]|nr:transcription termination/antitermination protein NusA [Anaerolineae bacterium]